MDDRRFKVVVDHLCSLPQETEWVEFKHNYHNAQEIGERISALANGACLKGKTHGYLVFGIQDNTHDVVGTVYSFLVDKVGNEELQHWLVQRLDPKLQLIVSERKYEDKNIVLIKINAAQDRPVRFMHEAYIRVGSITRKLREFPELEKSLWMLSDGNDFEKGSCWEQLSEDDVVKLFDCQKYFDLMGLPLPSTRKGILDKFKSEKFIIETEGTYSATNLGAILFAKDIREFNGLSRKAVRTIVYKGNNKLETLKDQWEYSGYAVCFERLLESILDKLPSNEEIQKALRKNVTVYPPLAIREILANALIHQDFNESGSSPMVEIYSDRIEISNPGKPIIKTERFIDEYKSRNEALASFLRRAGICEEKGSGIDKVIFQIELFQLPAPDFRVTDTSTKTILYNFRKLRNMDRSDKVRACYQHCCLKYVSNEKMTNASLRERFRIQEKSASSVSRIIADTISKGLIKYNDPKITTGRYVKYVPFWT